MLEDPRTETKNDAGIRRLIKKAAEKAPDIAGGAAGSAASSALGLLLGGLEGSLVGGVAGTTVATVLKGVGQELSARLLGPREEVRVGYVYTLAAAEIAKRIESGERVRTDGFFSGDGTGISDAQEVWESVLLKSQREPEEKKLPYMAHLLANLAFDSQIGVHMAHQITKAAEQLTYRQLCILKLVAVRDEFDLRKEDYRGQGSFKKELYQVLYECLDLYNRGYVNFSGEVAFGPTDIKPGSATVQGIGDDIFNLMRLRMIPNEDIVPIAVQLK